MKIYENFFFAKIVILKFFRNSQMEIHKLDKKSFSEKIVHLFCNSFQNDDKITPQLLTIFLSNPNENLMKVNQILEEKMELDLNYNKYNGFPEQLFPQFLDLTLKSENEVNYFRLENSIINGLHYLTVDYFMKIPSYSEEDITKIIGNVPQTRNEEIEDTFKVNTFSFDLISQAVGIFNSSCKTTSIHSSKDMEPSTIFWEKDALDKYKIMHKFQSESLIMRKNIVFVREGRKEGEWLDYTKAILKIYVDEMCMLRNVFMQTLLEMSAFQFVAYFQIPKLLLQHDLFVFLDNKTVEELNKENCEHIDSDIRDYWLETIETEARSCLKQF